MSYLNSLCLFLGLIFTPLVVAQQPKEVLRGLSSRPSPANAAPVLQQKAALGLPFRDDFSDRIGAPNPQLWADAQVYINQTLARSPITLGVASFDGLDENGFAYDLNRSATDTTDILTSRSIDLSSPTDSVYLSFFYQEAGWGEPPISQDSLILEFWNAQEQNWEYIWGVFGGQSGPFKQVMLPVEDRFHQSDFRFRFLSFGSPAGAFDLWHLDYLELDDQRNFRDTLVLDIAFTRPHPSLLENYEAVPWFHLGGAVSSAALAKENLRLHYRRNVDPSQSRPSLFLGEYTIEYQGTIVDQNGLPDANLDDSHPPLQEVRFPVPDTADAGRPPLDFLAPSYPGPFSLFSTQTYSGGSQNRSTNDTLRREQIFDNYYAYDDGSAERAYEILNNRNGWLVQEYDIFGGDTLMGIYLYFLPAANDQSRQEFSIVVLENNNGLPGALLYESDTAFVPQYTSHNFYLPYFLEEDQERPFINRTVFIGIRQLDETPLSLGYDQNRRNQTTAFYGRLGDFYQSFLPGTIMMRPFFRYAPADLGLPSKSPESQEIDVFPNPSKGQLHFRGSENQEIFQGVLFNLHGQAVFRFRGKSPQVLPPHLPNGLYLLDLSPVDGPNRGQQKLLLQR